MANKSILDLDYAKYDFKDPEKFVFKSEKGLSRQTVEQISDMKKEPEWMKKFRLRAYEHFLQRPMPTWGGNLSHIDFNDIYYYLRPTDKVEKSWDDVPEKIKKTFDRLGIPEAEKKFLAGVGAQYESEVVYHSLLKHLEDKGVIFCDTDTAVKLHPEIVKKYFGTIIPPEDNKMAALNSAVWSGGSFIYIPEGVKVDLPLQAYFRINAANMGQFERTLIIADNYADVQYIEGCTAPVYSTDSLHSAVVEIIAKKGARVRYTTLQNWSSDVYNLVTKRAYAYEDASVEWIDANVGSKLTMKYPSVYLVGPRAKAEIVSVAFAGKDRHQDTGAKAVHLAPYTSSRITAKSVSKDGGLTTYRGLVHVAKGAVGVKSSVRCVKPDTLILGDNKPIIEYDVGNHAVGASGENIVTRTYANEFDGDMVRIRAVGMFPIEVTPEHPILVSRSRMTYPGVMRNGKHRHTMKIALGSPAWTPASQLLAKHSFANGDYVLIPRLEGSVNVNELDLAPFAKNIKGLHIMEIKGHSTIFPLNVDTAWIIGLYVAEGYSSHGKIKFALGSNETDLVEKIASTFEKLGYKTRTYNVKDENAVEVVVFAEVLSRAFESWCGRGAPNKRIPDFVLLHNDPIIIDSFLEGYVRGDGALSSNSTGRKNIIHIVTTSKLLAMQIQLLGARKALFFRITNATNADHVQGRKVKTHEKYDVRCSLDANVQARIDERFLYVPIRSTERVKYTGNVYNLETSDHTYLVSNAISHNCDALLMDAQSKTSTYPYMEVNEDDATITHEATVGRINEDQLFYLMSRGLSETQALSMIVTGFMEPFTRVLPMEYAVEFNRLIEMEMEGAVG